jgi:histidinol-phosphatase (PHP family)
MWANFHMHSQYCDGTGNLSEYAAAAEEQGMTSIGFSGHAPVPFPCTWCMKKENLTAYLNEIDSLKRHYPERQLYKGLEIDYVPGVVTPADFKNVLDYTIGSIHFIDKFPEGKPWEIDGSHAVFLEGLAKIFNNNIRDAVSRYFELTRKMIEAGCPDVVGHLDKIKIQNEGGKLFHESDSWYREEISLTLDRIRQAGVIIEVNTRGVYQKKSETSYPSPWILEMIHARGIPVTLSSDAHHPRDITSQFEETAATLLAIGFKKISILKDGSWKPVTLNPEGIVF